MSPEMRSFLTELEEYLEFHSDVVDGSYGEQKPNRAMSLLTELRQLQEQPVSLQATACRYPECDCAIAGPTDTIRHVCPQGLSAERRKQT